MNFHTIDSVALRQAVSGCSINLEIILSFANIQQSVKRFNTLTDQLIQAAYF